MYDIEHLCHSIALDRRSTDVQMEDTNIEVCFIASELMLVCILREVFCVVNDKYIYTVMIFCCTHCAI